jgi:hypothetical protein
MSRKKVDRIEIRLPHDALERLRYLTDSLGGLSTDETLVRALRLFDRLAAAVLLEDAELVLLHRKTGRRERLTKRDL